MEVGWLISPTRANLQMPREKPMLPDAPGTRGINPIFLLQNFLHLV
jgi:hypothetical protein